MFKQYRRKEIAEFRPVTQEDIDLYKAITEGKNIPDVPAICYDDENHNCITISTKDIKAGSPKLGDMISRNPKNHKDQQIVTNKYFNDNFEEI